MRYDLDDLRLFTQVAAEGSITAGARVMHLSLPSASARVRALEAQAGVPLLIRERRGVRLTPAGATLARLSASANAPESQEREPRRSAPRVIASSVGLSARRASSRRSFRSESVAVSSSTSMPAEIGRASCRERV